MGTWGPYLDENDCSQDYFYLLVKYIEEYVNKKYYYLYDFWNDMKNYMNLDKIRERIYDIMYQFIIDVEKEIDISPENSKIYSYKCVGPIYIFFKGLLNEGDTKLNEKYTFKYFITLNMMIPKDIPQKLLNKIIKILNYELESYQSEQSYKFLNDKKKALGQEILSFKGKIIHKKDIIPNEIDKTMKKYY